MDHLFAFFSYETERNNSAVTSTGWYETPAFDGLAPSGSIASQFLTFPGAGVNSSGLIDQTCADAGLTEGVNCITIPGQGLNIGSPLTSPLGSQDLSWQSPTTPGVGGGLNSSVADIAEYTTVDPTHVVDEQYNGRLDANISAKDHAAFAIYWVPTNQTHFNGPTRKYNLYHHSAINDAFSGIWNHTFSPSFLNEARANAAGWRWNEVASNPQEPFGLPNDSIGGIGTITLQNFGAPGPSVFNQWTYTYRDIATKIAGNHIFVQDGWKVKPSFTLNVGLRYSYFGPLYSKQNNLYKVGFGSGANMLTGMAIQKGGDLWNAQKLNFGPQVGFAWTPGFYHQRVVIRGGYGLNYNQNEIAITGNVNGNPGLTVSPNFSMNQPTSTNPGILYQIPSDPHSLFGYPPNPNTIVSFGSNGLPTTSQVSVTAFERNMPTMYTEHWSLDTQTDLGAQFILSLGYQGSTGRHIYFHYDGNAVASVNSIPLNPQVNSVNFFDNIGHSSYNAMIAGLKHQFSHQFMLDVELTWARSMDTSSAPYSEQFYPYDTSLNWGRSDYDIRRQEKIFGLWQPTFFRGQHNVMERLIGGWSISGILNLHTGFPWSPIFVSPVGSVYCSTCGYSNLLPAAYRGGAGNDTSNDAFKSGPGVGNGTNKNFPNGGLAYFVPPAVTAGPDFPATGGVPPQTPGVRRNFLTGPGYRDVDATLTKSFGLGRIKGLGEGTAIEFRADAFNLFNNLNFKPGGASNGGGIADNITAPNFGQDATALGSRTVTLQARFHF